MHGAQPGEPGDEQSVAPNSQAVPVPACTSRGNYQAPDDLLRRTVGTGSLR